MKDVLDGVRVDRVGLKRHRIRIDFPKELCLDLSIGRVLQQIHETGVHRKTATVIIQYADLGELPIQGFGYLPTRGIENNCQVIPAGEALAFQMVSKKVFGFFIHRGYEQEEAYLLVQLAEVEHLLKYVQALLDIGMSRIVEQIHPLLEEISEKTDGGLMFIFAAFSQKLVHEMCKISGVADLLFPLDL